MYQQRYLITGGTGFIGTPLVKQLLLDDQQVTILSRDCVKATNHFAAVMKDTQGRNNKVIVIDNLDSLNPETTFDVVINLAGQGIADKRWTPEIKKQLIDSRIKTTRVLCEYLQESLVKPDVFISGSALGYYGLGLDSDHNAPVDESGEPDNSFSSQLCVEWENEAKCAEELGIRSCYLRTGIVLGKNGGALAKMLPAFKLGLGGPMGSGEQWMPWIHLDDLIGIINFMVENDKISGAVNGVAPNPVSNRVFSKTLGKVLKRPAFIPMPAFALKLMMGEMAEELLLAGRRVVPKKVTEAGYQFQYSDLQSALLQVVT